MKKLIILFLLLPSLLFSQVSPSKIQRIADASTVFGSALSYGTYLEMQSNNKTYKIINVNGVPGTAKFSDLVLNTDYIEDGTVTSVSTAAANNGVTATWSMASPTPALTIGLGAITPTSVNGLTLTPQATGFTVAGGTTSKTLTVPLDASVSGTNTGDQTNITGNAATVTTNANLTGPITSTGNATSIASQTGTGTMFVMNTSPTLVTPVIGAATGTSLSVSGQLTSTVATGTAPLVITSTTVVPNLNIGGNAATATTAGSVTTNANLTGPITSTGNATSIASQTGTGTMFVMNTSPTLVTPVIGAATGTSLSVSGQLTSTVATGTAPLVVTSTTVVPNLNIGGNAATATTAGTVTTNANLTGPITSTGNATSIASQTGTGTMFVMNTSPTLVTPNIGTPSAGVATNLTGTASGLTAGNVTTNANLTGGVTSVGNAATVVTNANLTGPITSVGNATSVASQTGTGTTFVMNTSPILVTPNIGTPSAGVATNLTGTASGLTAGNVTTNANLTGGVTSVGNAATVVTNANLTGGVTSVGNAATVVTNANLTGDVTSVGNATTVVTNANLTGDITSVGNATTITNNAVTLADFQTIATNSLLGRSTAATGNVEVLTVGGGLSLTAGTLAATQSSFRTQVTAASTVTLVASDAYAQQFTGSTASQIVKLPTTSIAAGGSYLIMNNSTVPITLQSSDGTAMRIIGPNSQVIATALIATPTTPAHWNEVSSSYYFQNGFRTQATAGSTLTLVVDDAYTQEFTGTTAGQIVKLPTTSVGAGQQFLVINNSTVAITVNSSASNLVQVVPPSTNVVLTALAAIPTTAAHWDAMTNRTGQASIVAASAAINTTETVIVQTTKLAANRLHAGTIIRITLFGTCTATVANTSTFAVRIGTAGTTADGLMASAVTLASAAAGTGIPFKATFELTIRTTGAAATDHGYLTLFNTGITGISSLASGNQVVLPTYTAFNTTTEANIISLTYKSAATSTTTTFQDAFIEIVYQ